jgi:hypothetical protein
MQGKNCKVYEVGEVAFNKAGSKRDRRNVLSHAHCPLRDFAGNKENSEMLNRSGDFEKYYI